MLDRYQPKRHVSKQSLGVTYCGWTKSSSHHQRNPGRMIFPSNSNKLMVPIVFKWYRILSTHSTVERSICGSYRAKRGSLWKTSLFPVGLLVQNRLLLSNRAILKGTDSRPVAKLRRLPKKTTRQTLASGVNPVTQTIRRSGPDAILMPPWQREPMQAIINMPAPIPLRILLLINLLALHTPFQGIMSTLY